MSRSNSFHCLLLLKTLGIEVASLFFFCSWTGGGKFWREADQELLCDDQKQSYKSRVMQQSLSFHLYAKRW